MAGKKIAEIKEIEYKYIQELSVISLQEQNLKALNTTDVWHYMLFYFKLLSFLTKNFDDK